VSLTDLPSAGPGRPPATPLPEADEADPAPGAELGALSRAGVVLISTGLILCIGVGDVLTGPDVNFTLLYLGPIAFGAWLGSTRWGFALSVLASIVSNSADLYARQGAPLPGGVQAWNLMVQLGVFVALVLLVTGLRDRLEVEQQMARTDHLTGLPNRRAFGEAATQELERARRSGRPLSFAYLDCDGFKFINDSLGHREGDALLVVAAQTMRASTRAIDVLARLGGDEFGLLMHETDAAAAVALVTRVRANLLAAVDRHGWHVGFSIGVATFVEAPNQFDDLLARGDELMYEAKRTARGSIRAGSFGVRPGGATGPLPAPTYAPGREP
jgi:diguanylate cyclase (GGDEF)-like protein